MLGLFLWTIVILIIYGCMYPEALIIQIVLYFLYEWLKYKYDVRKEQKELEKKQAQRLAESRKNRNYK